MQRVFWGFLGAVLTSAVLALAAAPAQAQSAWPTKPIKMIIPFPPGGVSDVMGRFWAQKLSGVLGQQVIVENRPGAGTTIAADAVAKSPADGHTLYFADVTTHAINATLYKKLPYDTVKDFTPVALVAATPLLFVVPTSVQANSLKDFIALAKSKPGQLNYASSGNGTILHLSGETLKTTAGIDLVHVPYKGSAPAVAATLAGDTTATFSTTPAALPHVRSGKLRALGVTSTKANPALPDVPPMSQTVPGFEILLYSGIFAPAGTPEAIVKRINAEISKGLKDADTVKLYADVGAEPVDMSPAQFSEHLRKEIQALGDAVRRSGATID